MVHTCASGGLVPTIRSSYIIAKFIPSRVQHGMKRSMDPPLQITFAEIRPSKLRKDTLLSNCLPYKIELRSNNIIMYVEIVTYVGTHKHTDTFCVVLKKL